MNHTKLFEQFINENIKNMTIGTPATNSYQEESVAFELWALKEGLKNTYGKDFSKGKQTDPSSAKGKLAIYAVTEEKENPYTKNDLLRTIPANTIIAVCDGKKPLYFNREPMFGPPYEGVITLTPEQRTNHPNNNFGYHDHESGKYSSGIKNLKRIIELADVAYTF
jgi:hypothetical protein